MLSSAYAPTLLGTIFFSLLPAWAPSSPLVELTGRIVPRPICLLPSVWVRSCSTRSELDPVFLKESHLLKDDDLSVAVTLRPDDLVFDSEVPNPSINRWNAPCFPNVTGEWRPVLRNLNAPKTWIRILFSVGTHSLSLWFQHLFLSLFCNWLDIHDGGCYQAKHDIIIMILFNNLLMVK